MHRLVLEERGVAQMLVDGVGGHFGDVLRRLGLDVEGDEGVGHEVMDRLEPLLPDEVLPIVEQPVVEGLVTKPAETEGRGRGGQARLGRASLSLLSTDDVSTLRPRCASLAAFGFP